MSDQFQMTYFSGTPSALAEYLSELPAFKQEAMPRLNQGHSGLILDRRALDGESSAALFKVDP